MLMAEAAGRSTGLFLVAWGTPDGGSNTPMITAVALLCLVAGVIVMFGVISAVTLMICFTEQVSLREALFETVHLLRSPRNARRLLDSLRRALDDEGESQSLYDLREELGLAHHDERKRKKAPESGRRVP